MEYLYLDRKFRLVKKFDMGDGYVILAYERVKPVDIQEVNFYREALDEENKQYPSLYEDVFEAFVANKQL
ncbi:hypothetical protein DXA13_20330 [Clostridium sp. AM58-1XD]|nr:hypothetical protein DXA13_20330 [Clostridium sp. AM58-1XD]